MTAIDIGPFAEADAAGVEALWREVFPHEPAHNVPAEIIACKLARQHELFLVARADEAVVGTVLAGYDGYRGWIYKMAVSPRHQRRGVGTALLRRAENLLADLGCPKINLQVRTTNEAVIAFYEKLGYRVEPLVSMGKRLPPAEPARG